jgi:hypothetical protein
MPVGGVEQSVPRVSGGVGPIDGMMARGFDVDGGMETVPPYIEAAVAMTETGRGIDTEPSAFNQPVV